MNCTRMWAIPLLAGLYCSTAVADVATTKASFVPGESVVVVFDGLSGSPQDWISVADRGSQPSQYREWTYTRGARQGSVTLRGLPAGEYEARAYDGNTTGALKPRFVRTFVVRAESAAISGAGEQSQVVGSVAISDQTTAHQLTQLDAAIAEIERNGVGGWLAKKTAIEGLKLAVKLGYSEPMQRFVWGQLQLNGALIVNLILQNPSAVAVAAIKAVPSGAMTLAVSAATPVAAELLSDAVFRSDALTALPESLHSPLKALLQSALIEMVSVGLGAVSGHPAALVGPVVRRIDDLRNLYSTVGALGRALDDGLVATAFGVEASAHLGVDFQDPRSQQVARSVYGELDQRLVDIVGKRFEADVREIYRLGHRALVAQRRGESEAARSYVNTIQRKGELAQGVHPFSAITSTGFWADVVARGGVAPVKRAAIVIIVATRLKDL